MAASPIRVSSRLWKKYLDLAPSHNSYVTLDKLFYFTVPQYTHQKKKGGGIKIKPTSHVSMRINLIKVQEMTCHIVKVQYNVLMSNPLIQTSRFITQLKWNEYSSVVICSLSYIWKCWTLSWTTFPLGFHSIAFHNTGLWCFSFLYGHQFYQIRSNFI